ncbi:MAG: dihydroneopterin triphosphate diphosphatase [Arenicellales bacterium]
MTTVGFKRPESVLVVVFTGAGDVLLLKRSDHPDFWQSVTGSLKWGESAPDAARRELQEETGLRCDGEIVDRHREFSFEILDIWRHRFPPGVTHNLEHVFSLELTERPGIRINPGEHSEFTWEPRAAAADKVWSWTNRRAILDIVPR